MYDYLLYVILRLVQPLAQPLTHITHPRPLVSCLGWIAWNGEFRDLPCLLAFVQILLGIQIRQQVIWCVSCPAGFLLFLNILYPSLEALLQTRRFSKSKLVSVENDVHLLKRVSLAFLKENEDMDERCDTKSAEDHVDLREERIRRLELRKWSLLLETHLPLDICKGRRGEKCQREVTGPVEKRGQCHSFASDI
jgi:hypothetical protein